MKRNLFLVAAGLICAFALITWFKRTEGTSEDLQQTPGDPARQRITSFWDAYHKATQLRTEENFEAARLEYERALSLNPGHEESLYYLGNCDFEVGRYEDAVLAYEKLLQLNPNSQRGHSQLATVYSSVFPGVPLDFARARDAVLRSIEINPEQSGPFLRLGLIELQLLQLDAALEHFKTAAGFRSPEGSYLAGSVLYRQGRLDEALGQFASVFRLVEQERAISGVGMVVEGDFAAGDGRLPPLDAAGIKAQASAYWAAMLRGSYPEEIPEAFRVSPDSDNLRWQKEAFRLDWPRQISEGRTAWADFDQDGDLDVVVTSAEGAPYLYANGGGNFSRVNLPSMGGLPGAWNACWGDFDGDGDLDLYVLRGGFFEVGNNSLLRNDGHEGFSDVTRESGLFGPRASSVALFVDLDGDQAVDLLEGGTEDRGQNPFRVFWNDRGRFQEDPSTGALQIEGSIVDLAAEDFDRDGLQDIALMRWQRPLVLLKNNGRREFQDVTEKAGLSDVPGDGYSLAWFDYNRDDLPDLLVTRHAPYERAVHWLVDPEIRTKRFGPKLFAGTGNGFRDVSLDVGLDRAFGTMKVAVADLDGDAWSDLVLANGGLEESRLEPSVVLRNNAGRGFEASLLLPSLQRPARAWWVSVVDSDGDGRPELILAGDGSYELDLVR